MTLRTRSLGFAEKPTSRRHPLYEGREKVLFAGPDPHTCILYFKDETSLNDQKTITEGKGAINNRISELLMHRLGDVGIDTHMIKRLNMSEQLIRATEALPIYVIVHNRAGAEFAQRLGLEDGYRLPRPIIEFRFKSQKLGYPLVNTSHIPSLGWAREDEVDDVITLAQRINDVLLGQFMAIGIQLFSIKLEFGRFYYPEFFEGAQLLLIDEISPDTCHLVDSTTHKSLNATMMGSEPEKRREVYQDVARRLKVIEGAN